VRVGSLFSGYGGLDMAVGGDLAWYSEIEPAACKVMEAHHPGVPNIGDVTQVDWSEVEPVDVLTGGYPCQPFSQAGHRKGENDERHLWPHVRDAISALGPRVTILENVRGHLTLGFASVLADLADLGLSARWGVVRASDAGAPHNRARLFVVAFNSDSEGSQGSNIATKIEQGWSTQFEHASAGFSNAADSHKQRLQHTSVGMVDRSRPIATPRHSNAITDSAVFSRWSGGDENTSKREQGSDQFGGSGGFTPDTGCERHGSREVVGMVGRLDAKDRWSRQEFGTGGSETWGQYWSAINRWENVIGRRAPAATVRRNDRDKLNPVFVEWMMGLPEGWVTGHGLSASQELKLLGNGVVPQQAQLALEFL